jgi:hypothetical protein
VPVGLLFQGLETRCLQNRSRGPLLFSTSCCYQGGVVFSAVCVHLAVSIVRGDQKARRDGSASNEENTAPAPGSVSKRCCGIWAAVVVLLVIAGACIRKPESNKERCSSYTFQETLALMENNDTVLHLGLSAPKWTVLSVCVCS